MQGAQLRFGDCVVLHGQQDLKQVQNNQGPLRGLMTCRGFGQDAVYLDSFQMNLIDDNESKVITIKNYRDCVFQIWPKLDFEAHKEFKKLNKSKANIERQKQLQEDEEEDDETKKQQESYYNDVVDKLRKIRQRCDVERTTNYNQIEQAKGKPVTYGQEIFIMHKDSGSFLNGQVSCSSSDQSAYNFELSKIFNKGMIFKVMPRYKLRQEGENIQYKDNVLLLNQKLNCYVNFNTQVVIPLDLPLPAAPQPYYKAIDIQRPEGRQRYECFVSNMTECTWQLLYFNSLPDTEVYNIMGHDLIYLKHTETQGLLSADFNYAAEKNITEVYVRNYQGQEENERLSVFSIWECEMPTNFARGEELVLLSRTTNPQTNQISLEPNKFILRHFLTGKILQCQQVKIGDKTMIVPCLANDDKTLNIQNCHIQFISTSGDEKEMMENNICYVMAIDNKQISVEEQVQYFIPESKKAISQNNYQKFSEIPESDIFQALKNSEMEVTRFATLCEDKGTQEQNAFQVLRVEDQQKEELMIVASQVSVLQRFVALVKAKSEEVRTNKDIIRSVQKAITFLIFFVSKSSLEPTTANALECQGVPIPSRQRLVRDFRLLELLMDIIYYPFKLEIVKIDQIGEVDEEFVNIFKLAYQCVKMSIREYRPNELYASQWLHLMIKQAKMTVDDGDIGAEEALTELIDNNRRILETKIDKDTIGSFMEMLLEEKQDKYVQMVYAICVCNDTPMIFNQSEVSQLLLKNQAIKDQLVYPILKKNGTLYIVKDDEEIDLKLFCRNSDSKEFKFFLEMLSLCSGLCLGRNYLAIMELQSVYPLEICHEIISEPTYDINLRCKFTRLVIHLWMDKAPHVRIILPDRIRIWNEIEQRDDSSIPSAKHDFSQLQVFKQFAVSTLEQESMRGFMRMFEAEQNKFTLEVLNMLLMMMEFGFYMSTQEIIQIVKPLLKLLKGVFDVSDAEEETFINRQLRPDNNKRNHRRSFSINTMKRDTTRLTSRYEDSDTNLIVHKIKQSICHILNHVVKVRDSTRLSYILQKFREDSIQLADGNKNVKRSKVVPEKEKDNDLGQTIDAFDYAKKPLVWVDTLLKNPKINLQGEDVEQDLVLTLLDLTLYKYDELVNMSFELIQSLCNERYSLLQSVKEVQLLEEEYQIQTFNQIQDASVQLGELVEKSEQWLWNENDIQNAEKSLKMIKLLEKLAEALVMKDNKAFEDEPDGELIPLPQDIQSRSERDVPNQLFQEGEKCNSFTQDLIRNIKIYEDILSLLRFDAEQFTYLRSKGEPQYINPASPSFMALKLCYLILGRFCYMCPENQALLLPDVKGVFMKHLRYLPNVGQHVMLEPLLTDNRSVLQDQELMQIILSQMISTIDKLPITDGLKPSYFQCLLALTKNKGKVLKINQTMIINELTHRDNQTILVTYQENFGEYEKLVSQFTSKLNIPQLVKVPELLDYFSGFMYLMAIICEDKNNATESKTQNYFPLPHFMKLIEVAKNNWFVVKNLIFFFYHVYLDTEREMNDELLEYKKKLINLIKSHIDEIGNSQPSEVTIQTYRGLTNLREVRDDYFFNSLLLCVETIIKRRMIDDYEQREQFHESLTKTLFEYARQLDKSHVKYRKIVKNAFALLISVNALSEDDLTNRIDAKLIPSTGQITQVKRGQKHIHSFTKEGRQDYKSIQAEKLRQRFEILENREDFKQQQRDEINTLITKIVNIEDLTKKKFKGACTIPFEEIIKSMIDFTMKNAKSQPELTVSRLQIFQKLIEEQNTDTNKGILEWESEDYQKFKISVVKAQNQMVELGIIKMLYSLMMDENQPKQIVEESVNLSIALLLGGNKQTQDAFYKEMTGDSSNALFVRLKDALEKGFDQVKKTMSLYNKRLFDQLVASNNAKDDQNELLDVEDQELERADDLVTDSIEEEDKNSLQYIIRILRMLQLFCEGHNRTMQDYLRHQVIENQVLGRNHDFIYHSAVLFSTYVKFVNVHCLELGNQLIDFIMEAVQGPCAGNQEKLVGAKIIDTCKDLMQKFQHKGDFEQFGFKTDDDISGIEGIITKSTKLLLALIEGKANPFILESMSSSLDFELLFEKLKIAYKKFKNDRQIESNEPELVFETAGDFYPGDMRETFSIFILMKQLETVSEDLKTQLDEYLSPETEEDPELCEAIKFYDYATKSVEILFEEDLIRVYFPLQPICQLLSKNTRTRLMTDIPRDSPNEKIEGLVEEAEACFDEIEHMNYLRKLPFNFSQDRLNFLRNISTLVAFVINFFILLTYHKELDPTSPNKAINASENFGIPTNQILQYLGYIQLGTSSLMLLFWAFIHSPLLLTLKWRQFVEENQKDGLDELYLLDKYEDNDTIEADDLPVSLTLKLLYMKGPSIPLFNRGLFRNFGNNYTMLMYQWKNFTFIFGDGNVKYFFFYITVSFVGNFVSEIVFSLHLLDVIERFPTLQNVTKAITTNGKQLLLTSMLGLIVMYIWAIVGFYFLDDMFTLGVYDVNGDELTENQCTTLLQCFVVVVNHGLIMGGGIADLMSQEAFTDENAARYGVRYVYDLAFFMIIKMAFLNIIFGIIIDTFADLRDKRNTMEEDMKNVCFICGIERDEFDQFADGFEKHIERDHHLWNYLYYLYHLKITDETEYNGIESYVADKVQMFNHKQYRSHDQGWFPLLKAMSIQKEEEEDDEAKINTELEIINKSLRDVTMTVERISKSV